MGLVIEHSRDVTADFTETTLFDDHERHTGRRQVLLRTAVDDIVLAHVDRTTQDIRTHIGYQRYIAFLFVDLSQLLVVDLGTEDGVVGCDMEIISVLRNLVLGRDVRRAGCYFDGLTETLGFLEGFLAPYTGVQVRCLLLQQVKRHHAELQARTATKEQHAVSLRDIQQLFHQCLCLVHHRLEILRAVRDLQNRQTFSLKIDHGFRRLFDHFLRQDTRSCVKIVLLHVLFKCIKFMIPCRGFDMR